MCYMLGTQLRERILLQEVRLIQRAVWTYVVCSFRQNKSPLKVWLARQLTPKIRTIVFILCCSILCHPRIHLSHVCMYMHCFVADTLLYMSQHAYVAIATSAYVAVAVYETQLKCRLVLRLDSVQLLANEGLQQVMAAASATSVQIGANRKV